MEEDLVQKLDGPRKRLIKLRVSTARYENGHWEYQLVDDAGKLHTEKDGETVKEWFKEMELRLA